MGPYEEHLSDAVLLEECFKNNRQAQNKLYEKYAPKLFGTCLRYAKNNTDAEDILQEGFIKIFKYLKDFRNEGYLEGWMRKIMVTTALNFYKKKNLLNKNINLENVNVASVAEPDAVSMMSNEELLSLVQQLPDGYRMVFNLYSIEGYSHKKIGEMLDISINTSKSQLARARISLQHKLYNLSEQERISQMVG